MQHAFSVLFAWLLLLGSLPLLAQPANPPAPGNWRVVNELTDNFANFNSGKWVKRNFNTGPEGHRWRGRAPGEFHSSQSTVQNGRLRITATAKYNPGNAQTNCDFWLKTGFVYSKAKAKVGDYTECSMRASDLSMASSFWLKLGTINNQEIDVTETYGNGRNTRWWDDKIRSNTHVFKNGQDLETKPAPIDVTNGPASSFPRNRFYRVGMHWKSATQMDIYVDGTRRLTMNTKNGERISEDLRLIWDMEPFVPACSSGPGAPDYAHVRPNNPTRRNYMEVEWVKTWRPAAGGGGGGGGGGPVLPNGLYELKSPGNGQNLGAFSWNGHDARMINAGNFADQRWNLWHLGGNVYHVRNQGTGRFLEVPYARCQPHNVKTYTSGAGNHQRWFIEKVGSNYILRPNHCRAQALDRNYGRVNANVGTYNYSRSNGNLQWRIVRAKTAEDATMEGELTPEGKDSHYDFAARLSPNPAPAGAATALAVTLPEDGEVSVEVFDVAGRRVAAERFAGARGRNASTLTNQRLGAGVYLVRIGSADDFVTERLVVR